MAFKEPVNDPEDFEPHQKKHFGPGSGNQISRFTAMGMMKCIHVWMQNNLGLTLLLLVTLLIYIPGLRGDFVCDDVPAIKNNPYIHGISHFTDFFTRGFWANTALENNAVPMYRPLVLVFHSLNYGLWENNATGYHIFSLLLHLANVLLVYILVRKLTAGTAIAPTIGAAIFALHPARVESVAWVSGIPDPLVLFFLLLTLFAHRCFTENQSRWRYLALSLISFQMALWSKEVALVFPLIVMAHDLIYSKRIYWLSSALYTMQAAFYLAVRNLVLVDTGKWSSIDLSQFSKAIDLILDYCGMLVFPARIPFYTQPPELVVTSALGVAGAIAMALLAGFSWRAFDAARKKILVFSAIWLLGFSWQAILIMFYKEGYFAARFLYVPAVGVALFAAVLYDHLNSNYHNLKIPIIVLCVLIPAYYGIVTWKEIPAWHNDETLYTKVVNLSPRNAPAYISLANFQLNRGDSVAAEGNYQLALKYAKPPKVRVEALLALGTIYGMGNNPTLSERYLKEAVQIDPKKSEAWVGLGNLAWSKGNPYEAISFYEKALAVQPENYEAAMNLAMAYDNTGKFRSGALIRQQAAKFQRP